MPASGLRRSAVPATPHALDARPAPGAEARGAAFEALMMGLGSAPGAGREGTAGQGGYDGRGAAPSPAPEPPPTPGQPEDGPGEPALDGLLAAFPLAAPAIPGLPAIGADPANPANPLIPVDRTQPMALQPRAAAPLAVGADPVAAPAPAASQFGVATYRNQDTFLIGPRFSTPVAAPGDEARGKQRPEPPESEPPPLAARTGEPHAPRFAPPLPPLHAAPAGVRTAAPAQLPAVPLSSLALDSGWTELAGPQHLESAPAPDSPARSSAAGPSSARVVVPLPDGGLVRARLDLRGDAVRVRIDAPDDLAPVLSARAGDLRRGLAEATAASRPAGLPRPAVQIELPGAAAPPQPSVAHPTATRSPDPCLSLPSPYPRPAPREAPRPAGSRARRSERSSSSRS
jgi:hypothetical protein